MQCRFCEKELTRKNYCDLCSKPQLDASDVVWTDRTCRQCYITGPLVLNEMSPYCFDCRVSINSSETTSKVETDNVIKKQVRWLQSWLLIDETTSHSALISWFPPQFINDANIKVNKYYLRTNDGSVLKLLEGDTTQIILSSLESGKTYELILEAHQKS